MYFLTLLIIKFSSIPKTLQSSTMLRDPLYFCVAHDAITIFGLYFFIALIASILTTLLPYLTMGCFITSS